jgi:hypothetical protein
MSKIIPIETIVNRLSLVHCDVVTIDEKTYMGSSKKAIFTDKDFGIWSAYVSNVLCGHNHPARGKLKTKSTCIKRYGCTSPLGNNVIKEKSKLTNIARYGTQNPAQCDIIQNKIKATMLIRHGVDNPAKSKEIQRRKLLTMKSKYGVFYPLQSKEIFDKMTKTNIKRYGVKNVMQLQQTKTKLENTCLLRYGVKNPSQSINIHNKTIKSIRKSKIIKHWKSNEDLYCVGSYELATINWLNKNKINFMWQVPFKISSFNNTINEKTYIIDLFLSDIDTYVEIKGYWMQEISYNKWCWFHTTYPNSELWTYDILKNKGIL